MQIHRRKQTAADKMLYTKKAVAKVLNLAYNQIEFIYVGEESILVGLYNNSIKLDKQSFREEFVKVRKIRSQTIAVRPHPNELNAFVAENQINHHSHTVQLTDRHVFCDCEDYQKQYDNWQQGCCKHGYAVLNHLGYSSLQEYIHREKETRAKHLRLVKSSVGIRIANRA